ncbi:hypothetical protein [Diaphorobacter sp. J5-51]|uniref:hypothetical protein n=1 Tax=Diaphorobacter sp. J5-51 TaxID=680496 RepID=UPI000643B4FD|nr:hypothetical protein [Diaphorobacter sp. J5-51]KLR57303.1 hypothetical protein OX89_13225 [Diaphorobacter sp. J5-51]
MNRSPIEILGAILDEVEGLRRTDAQSHLPEALIREARTVFDVGASATESNGVQLQYADGLEGRTVSHVFSSDLRMASIVIVCTDGAFLALDVEDDDGGSVCVHGGAMRGRTLADYLKPAELVAVGLMTEAERQRMERQQKTERLKASLARYETQIEATKREIAALALSGV